MANQPKKWSTRNSKSPWIYSHKRLIGSINRAWRHLPIQKPSQNKKPTFFGRRFKGPYFLWIENKPRRSRRQGFGECTKNLFPAQSSHNWYYLSSPPWPPLNQRTDMDIELSRSPDFFNHFWIQKPPCGGLRISFRKWNGYTFQLFITAICNCHPLTAKGNGFIMVSEYLWLWIPGFISVPSKVVKYTKGKGTQAESKSLASDVFLYEPTSR